MFNEVQILLDIQFFSLFSPLYFGKILCRSNDVRTSSDKCSDSSGLQRMYDVVGITRVSID